MSFIDLSKRRESCRTYADKPVADADIRRVLEAAMLSPSACNSQPWKFVVCQGELAKSMPGCILNPLLPFNKWVNQAQTFVVICETKAKLMGNLPISSQHYAQMDIGIATAALCFAASDLGLSTCILGSFNEKKVKDLLNIPKDIPVRLIITIGYAKDDAIREKKRKAYDEVVSVNGW